VSLPDPAFADWPVAGLAREYPDVLDSKARSTRPNDISYFTDADVRPDFHRCEERKNTAKISGPVMNDAGEADGEAELSPEQYLRRLGLSPDRVTTPDLVTLSDLQRSHVRSVPFETFSITGDPHSSRAGGGVDLSLRSLYRKIVDTYRGGFCFELNGAFGWLLRSLGYDVTRIAARMVTDIEMPANHHVLLVTLDRPYLVDVGMGAPMLRAPVPLDDVIDPDTAGVQWRTVASDRPDAPWLLQYRETDSEWQDRYVFETTSRALSYFAATCDYLQRAPESGFTGAPVVTRATRDGYLKLKPAVFLEAAAPETTARAIDDDEFYTLLEHEFGITFPPEQSTDL
jgi:N-hydroxyarylamine O-acetyltransferase